MKYKKEILISPMPESGVYNGNMSAESSSQIPGKKLYLETLMLENFNLTLLSPLHNGYYYMHNFCQDISRYFPTTHLKHEMDHFI